MVQAVVVYMKDHYPTTPEELNFHAELKAASKWYWLKDNGNSLALKEVPSDDWRLKIAVRQTLQTWEKEEKDLESKLQAKQQAKLQGTNDSDSSYDDVDDELSGEPEKPWIEYRWCNETRTAVCDCTVVSISLEVGAWV